ncbi:MAG: LysR family transcriptional regulator [Acetobacteraceae bacterium]
MQDLYDGRGPADILPDLAVKHLRAVVALGRCGKFTAAAAELGLSQPGLSRTIRQAEVLLGVDLFLRGSRRVAQTPAGRAFIPVAERILDTLGQQARRVRSLDGELHGQLVVSCLMSVSHHVLPAALAEFRTLHPRIHIRLREGLQSDVEEHVRTGIADFGVGSPPVPYHGIRVQSVADERCYAVLPAGHRLAGRPRISLRDLAGETFVSMPPEAGLRRLIDAEAARQTVTLDHGIVVNQYRSLFDFVARGLGVAVVPAAALPPDPGPALASCPLRPAIRRRIGVLHLAERPLSAVSAAFLDIFRPLFLDAARAERSLRPGGRSPAGAPGEGAPVT